MFAGSCSPRWESFLLYFLRTKTCGGTQEHRRGLLGYSGVKGEPLAQGEARRAWLVYLIKIKWGLRGAVAVYKCNGGQTSRREEG